MPQQEINVTSTHNTAITTDEGLIRVAEEVARKRRAKKPLTKAQRIRKRQTDRERQQRLRQENLEQRALIESRRG